MMDTAELEDTEAASTVSEAETVLDLADDLADDAAAELAARLRPSLLRFVRQVRQQRVDTSITLTQLSAMYTLRAHGPMSAGDLAASEKVQPPSMTKVIASLEERGLVRRAPNPTDGRQVIISITEPGSDLLDSEQRSRNAWMARRLATLSAADRDLLDRVVPILDKLAAQ